MFPTHPPTLCSRNCHANIGGERGPSSMRVQKAGWDCQELGTVKKKNMIATTVKFPQDFSSCPINNPPALQLQLGRTLCGLPTFFGFRQQQLPTAQSSSLDAMIVIPSPQSCATRPLAYQDPDGAYGGLRMGSTAPVPVLSRPRTFPLRGSTRASRQDEPQDERNAVHFPSTREYSGFIDATVTIP